LNLWMDRIETVFRTGQSLCSEDAVPVGDRLAYSESVLSPIRYPDGEMFAVSAVYHDVTEQKLLQQQLVESEKKYRDLYENAHVALYRMSISDSILLDCNRTTLKLFGYTEKDREELVNHYSVKDSHTTKSRIDELVAALKKHKKVKGFEAEVKRKDGTIIWISISAEIFPERGYVDGVLQNITASKILSEREMEILRIVLTGKSNKGIAYQLDRSVRTIEDHRAHIMHKLGVDNVVDLTRKALEYGITPDGE